jgi:hypothetical protein
MKSRIAELETENAGLREALESANRLIEADTEMHAKDVEKSIELIKLAKENQRLRDLICAWWCNAITPTWYMRKKDIKDTIAILAEKNKEVEK